MNNKKEIQSKLDKQFLDYGAKLENRMEKLSQINQNLL